MYNLCASLLLPYSYSSYCVINVFQRVLSMSCALPALFRVSSPPQRDGSSRPSSHSSSLPPGLSLPFRNRPTIDRRRRRRRREGESRKEGRNHHPSVRVHPSVQPVENGRDTDDSPRPLRPPPTTPPPIPTPTPPTDSRVRQTDMMWALVRNRGGLLVLNIWG